MFFSARIGGITMKFWIVANETHTIRPIIFRKHLDIGVCACGVRIQFLPPMSHISQILTWNAQNKRRICVTKVLKQNQCQSNPTGLLKIFVKIPQEKNLWASSFTFESLKMRTSSKYKNPFANIYVVKAWICMKFKISKKAMLLPWNICKSLFRH